MSFQINDTKTRAGLIEASIDYITNNETINTITGLPTALESTVKFENRIFETSNKPVWFSIYYRPNTPISRTIGAHGIDAITGFIQIDINTPENTGESVHIEWEKKARLYFFPGRSFIYDGHKILVTACGMSQGRHVDNYYRKSVTVSFTADLNRNTH
ncbi:DUF4128 domain-containing protein [Akkermansiaceae bacterium]|nr:DUF4128 domain-containing protein [Akkermansiaceae bacterium]